VQIILHAALLYFGVPETSWDFRLKLFELPIGEEGNK